MWYAWHWHHLGRVLFLFFFGMVFLFGAAYYRARNRLPDDPERIDLETAHRRVDGAAPSYVALEAEPDLSRKIYRTGAWAPFWGNCPPGDVHVIHAADAAGVGLNTLLGCAVTVTGRVDIGGARTVQRPLQGGSEDTVTVSLAPLGGTRERIWVKSNAARGTAVDMTAWQTGNTFSGVLANWSQALSGLPGGLSGWARQSLPDLSGAYVVCPVAGYQGESMEFFRTHFWVPLKGSDRLFLWTGSEDEDRLGGTVTGVLLPLSLTDHQARDRCFAHFETVTGAPLPERIGVIEYPTAEAYNRKLSGYSGIFAIFGVMWTVFGLAGIVLYIKAPDLIYGAWMRALAKLSIWAPPVKQTSVPQPEPVSDKELERRTGIRSVYMPPESRDPPQTGPSRREILRRSFVSLRGFDPAGPARYVSFIQDFSLPNNLRCALVLVGCSEDMAAAESDLINTGQRHPGFGIELLAVSAAPLAGTSCLPPAVPEKFDLRVHDYVVLGHAPARGRTDRVVVCAVFDGLREETRCRAEAALAAQEAFALMGRVFVVGDSENGPCGALTRRAGSTMLEPLR